jgi:hypothetical protein
MDDTLSELRPCRELVVEVQCIRIPGKARESGHILSSNGADKAFRLSGPELEKAIRSTRHR